MVGSKICKGNRGQPVTLLGKNAPGMHYPSILSLNTTWLLLQFCDLIINAATYSFSKRIMIYGLVERALHCRLQSSFKFDINNPLGKRARAWNLSSCLASLNLDPLLLRQVLKSLTICQPCAGCHGVNRHWQHLLSVQQLLEIWQPSVHVCCNELRQLRLRLSGGHG